MELLSTNFVVFPFVLFCWLSRVWVTQVWHSYLCSFLGHLQPLEFILIYCFLVDLSPSLGHSL